MECELSSVLIYKGFTRDVWLTHLLGNYICDSYFIKYVFTTLYVGIHLLKDMVEQCKAANKYDDPCQTFRSYILRSSSPTRTLYSLEVSNAPSPSKCVHVFWILVDKLYIDRFNALKILILI